MRSFVYSTVEYWGSEGLALFVAAASDIDDAVEGVARACGFEETPYCDVLRDTGDINEDNVADVAACLERGLRNSWFAVKEAEPYLEACRAFED